ncbi:MAG: hypothetical protein JSR39_07990 [Verrucomicrobia bacterium]|nr:hypothetical protein [Verrucomicrobiota bacterium]
MSYPVDRREIPDLNRIDLVSEAPSSAQYGMAATPTSISSLRESTHAEPTSFLCDCFTSIANWFKSAFMSLFGISSNAQPEFSREWLVEKGNAYIDGQFDRHDLAYPLKALVVIELGNRVIASPRSDVPRNVSDFKPAVKQILREALERENLQEVRGLRISTYFFNPLHPVQEGVTHSISRRSNHLNIPEQQPLVFQEMAGSHTTSSDFLLFYLRETFNGLTREELFGLANFLCSEHQHLLPLAGVMFGPRPTSYTQTT